MSQWGLSWFSLGVPNPSHPSWTIAIHPGKKKQAVQVSTSQPAIFQEVGINKLVTAMGTHNFPSFLGASYNPYIGGCNTFIFP